MNEFTKEELELMLHKFGLLTFDQFQGLAGLSMKINNMLEDYCEHEWHTNPYNYVINCQNCCKTIKCEKCERATNIIVKGN